MHDLLHFANWWINARELERICKNQNLREIYIGFRHTKAQLQSQYISKAFATSLLTFIIQKVDKITSHHFVQRKKVPIFWAHRQDRDSKKCGTIPPESCSGLRVPGSKESKALTSVNCKQNRCEFTIIIPKRTAGQINGFCKFGNWQKWDNFEQQINVKQWSVLLVLPINSRYNFTHTFLHRCSI